MVRRENRAFKLSLGPLSCSFYRALWMATSWQALCLDYRARLPCWSRTALSLSSVGALSERKCSTYDYNTQQNGSPHISNKLPTLKRHGPTGTLVKSKP